MALGKVLQPFAPALARTAAAELKLQQVIAPQPQLLCCAGPPAGSAAARWQRPAGSATVGGTGTNRCVAACLGQGSKTSERRSGPYSQVPRPEVAPETTLFNRTCRWRSMVAAGSSRPTSSSSPSVLMAAAMAVGAGASPCCICCASTAAAAEAAAAAAPPGRRGGLGGRPAIPRHLLG